MTNRVEFRAALSRALHEQDANKLKRLAGEDPVPVLTNIDASMRGLRDGRHTEKQLEWLRDQDRAIRRSVGAGQRAADIEILRSAYRAGDLFLTVGAGVSMSAGMPGWKALVIDVLEYALYVGSEEHRQSLAENIRAALSFAPATAEEEVRKSLAGLHPVDRTAAARIRTVRDDIAARDSYTSAGLSQATELARVAFGQDFGRHLQDVMRFRPLKLSETHRAIAGMVRPKSEVLTPRIFSIITYNFDDMIEGALAGAGLGCTIHSSRFGKWVSNRGLKPKLASAVDIYHVHGFAPLRWPLDTRGIDFVFSEKQYQLMYGERTSLTRAIHKSFFPGGALGLIVGCSLEDEYACAEMKAAHAEYPWWFNYALLQLPKKYREQSDRLTGLELEELGSAYESVGLRIIWFSGFEEIPTRLKEISALAAAAA
jgi:hypothetical protein